MIGPGGGGASGAIWAAKHNQAFLELANTRLFSAGLQGDPMISPDFCTVVYADIPVTVGLVNYVTVAPTNGTLASTDLASEPNASSNGTNTSLAPRFSPDGTKIVYHGLATSGSDNATIKRIDADGTNGTTLYTGNLGADARYPQYSDDGTKIVFFTESDGATRPIYTMNADGTGLVNVANSCQFSTAGLGTPANIPCFVAGTTQVAYTDASAVDAFGFPTTTAQLEWRVVNADGTGDTLLYTDPEPLNTHPSTPWGTTPYSSLEDGSGVLALQFVPGDPANEQYRVGYVDIGGGWTQIGTGLKSSGFDYRINVPVMRDGRIWWNDGMFGAGGDGNVSCLPDGSDFTVEDNSITVAWFGTA